MSVDPTAPITRPETLPTPEQDIDPDFGDVEDARESELNQQPDDQDERPEDWNEPPVVPANKPSPMSDDQR